MILIIAYNGGEEINYYAIESHIMKNIANNLNGSYLGENRLRLMNN